MEKNGFLLNDRKTDVPSRIPLLPPALKIINRFEQHPQCKNKDRVLPVLSNQKMNSYLKEIADACGINKNLTYHIAVNFTIPFFVSFRNKIPETFFG